MAKKSNLIVFLGQKFQSNTSVCVLVFQIGLWKKTVPVSKSLLVKCWSRPAVLFVMQAVQHYQFEMFEYDFYRLIPILMPKPCTSVNTEYQSNREVKSCRFWCLL